MGSVVTVKNIKIGEGVPKICVSLIGKDDKELLEEIKALQDLRVDIVEWRMDYYTQVKNIDRMKETLKMIRSNLGEKPLLATFRSKKEGGECVYEPMHYAQLNEAMIETGNIDLIDVEFFSEEMIVEKLIKKAHEYRVKVIMSNHDFDKTPSETEIVDRLCKMQQTDADLLKIAVMPHDTKDVLTLLSATNEMVMEYANRPIVTMAMGKLGVVSRLMGETFGSALTFGAINEVSAPGQIEANDLANILSVIHKSI